MQTGDPLVRKIIIAHPDHPPKIIEIGPFGVIVTEVTCAPDMVIEVGTVSEESARWSDAEIEILKGRADVPMQINRIKTP